jgi:hypothetical protein
MLPILLASGCMYNLPLKVADVEAEHLSFLRDGGTSREEVLLRLGDPTGVFEDGRILTFRLEASDRGVIPVRREYDFDFHGVTQWRLANLSLVTVFDSNHVLNRHSLILVKP